MTKFDPNKKRARANGYWINYDRVVLATNNPLLGESSLITGAFFQTKLALYSSYVVGGTVPRGSIPIASFWDTNDPYQYLRVDRHGDSDYAIFGGEDHKTGQGKSTESRFRKIAAAFRKLAPSAKIDHRWSGQIINSNDGLPYIGPNEGGSVHRHGLLWKRFHPRHGGGDHGSRLGYGNKKPVARFVCS